ncbi:hypothetical protein DAPPUDRAFT_313428 [Daphnia pulex]|uniref:Uncharacterized protein n=1 Tax=Daphnia pulex TaxID=6669 RepID=E9G480_DAPPU|nr:hypothetical protein DAPPUDRAFT_313428 [Daphnia pulex]|eukprot:EFX86059.1 hypothetical protein DAPPUDRAFT_313428 [Daphnia pulex]
MKTFACLAVLVSLCAVLAMAQADQITEPFCYWSGTAPACAGACETGEFVASTSKYGDGKTCATGVKRYCCAMPPQWLAQLAQSSFYVLNGGPVEPILPSGYPH